MGVDGFCGLFYTFLCLFSYQVHALLLLFKKIKMFTISSIRYSNIKNKISCVQCRHLF